MASFGEKLRRLRDEHELTQEELGKILNVKKAAISKYEADRISMNLDAIQLLCNHFKVPLSYFIDYLGPATHRLPILGTIRAGIPILTEENYAGQIDVPENIHADFVLEVVGDSMIGAGILEGDYAVCREAPEPQTGQIIVALRDEGSLSEATLKFYFNGNGQPHLRAANPAYPDISYTNGYRCAGQMVALMRKDAPGYQVYKEYLAANDSEEWTEVIEKAIGYGVSPRQLSTNLDMQWQMAQKFRKED